MVKKIPLRKCVVTQERLPKKDLLRIVKNNEGEVFVDLSSKANGRGAYIKKDLEVVEKAIKTKIDTKQDTLVSGTNIKTVNGNSLLGSGDITISGGVAWGNITGNITSQTDLQTALNNIDCGTMS